jgi:hypothetical protein
MSGTVGDVDGKSRKTIVETRGPSVRYPNIPTAVKSAPTQSTHKVNTPPNFSNEFN